MIRQDAFRDVQARGTLTFTGALTGSPLVDLLSGLPTFTTLARLDNPQRLRTESYAWFVQDSYRVRPNVTLSAGLRYDLTSPPVDVDDRATLYDPQTGTLVPWGPAACRAPATRPTATTGRRVSAPRGRLTRRRPRCCAARMASTTTIRRSRRAKGCTSARRISIFPRSLPSPLGLVTLTDPFPSNFPIPTPNPAFGFQPDLRTPFLHEFNVTLQRQLGATRVAEVAYVGSRGRNLIAAKDINQPRRARRR